MLPPHYAQISLTTLPLNISVTPTESDEDARHRRRKDMIMFSGALVFVGILAAVAMLAAFVASGNDKQREWGMGVLLLIVGGCVGYLTGKSAR